MAKLDDNYPLLLFPLRLETRFKKEKNQNQLWLRVYPDDCNVVKKETVLTKEELENVSVFHCEMFKASGNESEERGAWRVLVNNHGANRAAWIIKQYKPLKENSFKKDDNHKVLVLISYLENVTTLEPEVELYWKKVWLSQGNNIKIKEAESILNNSSLPEYKPYNISEKLESDIKPEDIKVIVINLPHPDTINTSDSSWNIPPEAVYLPDRFVAITYKGNRKEIHQFEESVKRYLPVGLDPTSKDGDITKDDEGIHLNKELRWMVDFHEAVSAGMATKINLSSRDAESGFDKLFVIGLRSSSNPQSSLLEMEDLITKHATSQEGFEFILQGTPTNNTEESASGYSQTEDADESFNRVFKGTDNFSSARVNENKSDAQRFAEALGINHNIVQGIKNANGKDLIEAGAINRALFPATLGYFMEEMMDPLFSDNDIDQTERFFSEYVYGRGHIPAIKIGKQPYGILPVTNFSKVKFDEKLYQEQNFYIVKLYNIIKKIDETWDELVSQVSYIGKEGDPHQILLDVIGLHSNSVEFHQRYAQSIQQVYNQLILSYKNTSIANAVANIISQRGKIILQELGFDLSDVKLPILEKYFLSEPNILKGPIVDDVPESEVNPIRPYTADNKNYIEWLQSNDGNLIRVQDFGGNPVPNALLYMLLRHSLMLTQSSSATNLLLNYEFINSRKIFHDTNFLYIKDKEVSRSKFDHLYRPNISITGDNSTNLIEYIYNSDILYSRPETRRLKSILDSLKTLEKTPTARLERLLIEHLDNCTYRIDAWKAGLTFFRLKEQQQIVSRSQKQKGIHLGAYGWLLDLRPNTGTLQEKRLNTEDSQFFKPKGEAIYTDSSNLGYIHAPSIDQASTAAILRNAFDSNEEEGKTNPFNINLSSERVRIANDFLEGIRNGQSLSSLLGYQFEKGLHDRYRTSSVEADKFIYPLRMKFPLVANSLKSTKTSDEDLNEANITNNSQTSIESIEANNVIDGLKLIQHVQDNSAKTYPFGLSNLPSASTAEAEVITKEINRLIDIQDAIADLLIAEEVYQIVKGNFDRAAAVADVFSKGGYPPEMEVVKTPRTGNTLNHKMAIHFDAEASSLVSPNSLARMTPRASSEPSVNKWLSSILPEPEKVFVKVTVQEPGKVEVPIFISQLDLELQSIDLLYSAYLNEEQAMTELDDRIINHLYKTVHPFSKIKINYTDEIDPGDKSKVSFFELGGMLQSLRKLLLNRPYINKTAFRLPTDTSNSSQLTYNVANLYNRAEKLKSDLSAEKNSLSQLLSNYSSLFNDANDNFTLLPQLIKDTCKKFNSIALYDNILTGTGFIHQTITAFYNEVVDKTDVVIKRWDKKKEEYNQIMARYPLAVTEAEKIKLLELAERKLTSNNTYTDPLDIVVYKSDVEALKSEFDSILNELKGVEIGVYTDVNDFINKTNAVISKIEKFDLVYFDTENDVNNLSNLVTVLHTLKSEIQNAISNLIDHINKKIEAYENEINDYETLTSDDVKISKIINGARILLKEESVLLPILNLSNELGDSIKQIYDSCDSIQQFAKDNDNREFPVDDWFMGVARVRENAWNFENIISLSQSFNPNNVIDLKPLQFPYKENARWLAMKFKKNSDDNYEINGDALLYTAHFANEYDKTKPICGVVFDEWTEVIPAQNETTGVAFHYNQPNSEPPQTILLVTPSEIKGEWQWDDITGALEETLSMAKKRAVEPSMVDSSKLGHFLPTTLMAVTSHLITVAMNLSVNNIVHTKE